MHITPDDDPAITMQGFSASAQATIMKIDSDLAALAKRADSQDKAFADIMNRLDQDLEKYAAANRKQAEFWDRHHKR